MTLSALFVTVFLGLALILYVITGGADFGVGIVEMLATPDARPAVRRAGEKAIAPIWEANHIWIVVALVILFVAFPEIHVQMTKSLHIPMVIMLVGIVLRGSAFTFRYYDVGDAGRHGGVFSALFRGGSLLVPLVFGHLAAAMSRGLMRATPTTVLDSFVAPWVGAFPATAGIFTVSLFAWLASVFLVGEAAPDARAAWIGRARRWTVVMVAAGAATSLAAAWEGVPWIEAIPHRPLVGGIVAVATITVGLTVRALERPSALPARVLAGVTATAVVAGYFGAIFPIAIERADAPPLSWLRDVAPPATTNALAVALIAGSVLILPGLFWLYRLFVTPSAPAAPPADGEAEAQSEH